MDIAPLLPILRLASVFGLVILLIRLSSQVGLALGLGAAALGLVFSMSSMDIARAFGAALVDSRFLLVVSIVTLILILSGSMECLGQMEELLTRFKGWVGGRRWGLVAFPALIGLLPMTGGAVFSAPMLDSFDPGKQVIPSLKSFLNYWYRHIWEYWWPLYPGILLACALAEVDLWRYVVLASPMTVIAVGAGLPQLMQVPRLGQPPSREDPGSENPRLWRALCPFLLTILPGMGIGIFLQSLDTTPAWASLPKEAWLILGLLAAVGWAWWDRSISIRQVGKIIVDAKLLRIWLTLAGIFVFKTVMERSGAAQEVGEVLMQFEIPLEWIVILLSMVLGVMGGVPIAFVGTAFPIVVPLILAMGASNIKLPLTLLAYVSGFAGVILSPLHLCFILSNEYFQASWPGVYRRLWLPALIILGSGIGYFWVLKLLVG